MWRRFAIGMLALATACGSARGDTIVIEGVTHGNVDILSVGTRYYVKFPDGNVTVIEQAAVRPWEIAFGDAALDAAPDTEPEPAPQPSAVPTKDAASPAPPLPVALPVPPLVSAEGTLSAGAKNMVVSSAAAIEAQIEINALVLRVGENTIAFCAVDAAVVGESLVEGVARRLEAAQSPIGRGNLFLAATGVPVGRYPGLGEGPTLGPHSADAVNEAADHITLCITDAVRSLAPATVRIAEAEAPQYHKVRGAGSTTEDSALSVMAVAAGDGGPLAYLVNFALHAPVPTDAAHTGRRGAPGALAETLRAASGVRVPVLFFNGAAGDIDPVPPAGDDPAAQEAALGDALARAALSAIEETPPQSELRLAQRAREAYLPPSLLDGLLPDKVLLHEAWVGNAVFLSVPGIPAAQMGLVLRVQGLREGADQAFVLSLCGGYLGFQCTIEEFFVVTPTARDSFHGPLFVRWFSENFLGDGPAGDSPLWTNVRALERYAAGFASARERGAADRAEIVAAWRDAAESVDRVAQLLIEADAAGRFAGVEGAPQAVRAQLAAAVIRERYAGFTGEERAILMGIAEGAHVPFDAVLWLQVLANPGLLPVDARAALEDFPETGMDFLPG